MTWMERFEDTIKTPARVAVGWIDRMPALQRDEAHLLDADGATVSTGAGQSAAARNLP